MRNSAQLRDSRPWSNRPSDSHPRSVALSSAHGNPVRISAKRLQVDTAIDIVGRVVERAKNDE